MRELKRNVIISLVMVFIAMVLFANTVNASSSFIFGNDTSNTTSSTTSNTTSNTANTNTSTVLNTTTTTSSTNTQIVYNINDNASKDLPKTGENDTYVIATVGAVAIVVGGIAYVISKKYSI